MILHPQLEKECFVIGRLPLSALLLMNDANYPWFILVPQRQGVTEIHQLCAEDRQQLMRESCQLAAIIEKEFQAGKINIAALGNMVPQLHIHHIVRYRTDAAWPAPVWGRLPARAYEEGEAAVICRRMQALLVSGCGRSDPD